MKVGDRVRVKTSIIFYTHPLHRSQPFDAQGLEGTVIKILDDWQGRKISPNFPIHVEFLVEESKKNFKVHLREDELELIE
ncbi:MAG: ferredoxin--nitrite reductase [Leptolyngbyaceae cyanobacterium SM1_1_3]|nr:ferredoxin--nitrite reductase [Leptolyngbyaceae cyanobacterium SM1_1_3]NJN02332.1 ferredoxin--nitrite reductase [Leptolyngbyaceae cyanobacterium RM1_1_2]